MKYLVSIIALLSSWLFLFSATAQELRPLEGVFENKEAKLTLHLNAYEETVEVPGMSYLGPLHGYLDGHGVYGTWFVTSCKILEDETPVTAELRLSNDLGADSQTLRFTAATDSTYIYKAIGGNAIRKAVGRKLVKIEGEYTFRRSEVISKK